MHSTEQSTFMCDGVVFEAGNTLHAQTWELAEHCGNRVECYDKAMPCQKAGLYCKNTAGINRMGEYEKRGLRKSIVAVYHATSPYKTTLTLSQI